MGGRGRSKDTQIGREEGETKERKEVTEGRDLARESKSEDRRRPEKLVGQLEWRESKTKVERKEGRLAEFYRVEQERAGEVGKRTDGAEGADGYPGQEREREAETGDTSEGTPDEAGAEKGSGEGVTETSQPWLERKERPKGKGWRCEE